MTKPEIALVILCQNAWEELHLTLMQGKHGRFVDLRTYMHDQGRGKASPTGNSLTINLELWPQFIAAVGSPGNCIEPFPLWGKQRYRDIARSRLIFPQNVLQKKHQEQILLEHKNFQSITFISLKTLARSTKGQGLSQIVIGPLLWSQFMQGLKKMEERLIVLGILVREDCENRANFKSPLTREKLSRTQESRESPINQIIRSGTHISKCVP